MTYEEFDQYIVQQLAVLADTEHNRKKHKALTDLDDIEKQIEAGKVALEKAIANDQYDDAVSLKEDIARLASKAEIVNDIYLQFDKEPECKDDDLRKLSDELVVFYESDHVRLLKERKALLKKLEENYGLMEEGYNAYKPTKEKIDGKTADPNYACNRTFNLVDKDSQSLMDLYDLENMIREYEDDIGRIKSLY